MFKLNKWQAVCSIDRDRYYREYGWCVFRLGLFKVHTLPLEGEMIHRDDYHGFYFRIVFWWPVFVDRCPKRPKPKPAPEKKTLVWANSSEKALEFIAKQNLKNAKPLTKYEQLFGLRGVEVIDLGAQGYTAEFMKICEQVDYSIKAGRITLITENEFYQRQIKAANPLKCEQPPNYGLNQKPLN